jgi:hypothetical protein
MLYVAFLNVLLVHTGVYILLRSYKCVRLNHILVYLEWFRGCHFLVGILADHVVLSHMLAPPI